MNIIAVSFLLGFLSQLACAALPAGEAEKRLAEMKQSAAAVIVVEVTGIREIKDPSLVNGGFSCIDGTVKSIKARGGGKDSPAHRAGDKVSLMLSCQPDEVPLGPGQLPAVLCSKAKKAKEVQAWSSERGFPKSGAAGRCEAADLGFEIVK